MEEEDVVDRVFARPGGIRGFAATCGFSEAHCFSMRRRVLLGILGKKMLEKSS